jgi:hypothetical protein
MLTTNPIVVIFFFCKRSVILGRVSERSDNNRSVVLALKKVRPTLKGSLGAL